METIQVKEVQKLKLNVTNINSFLKKSSKDYTKVKKDNKRLVSDQNKIKKTKEKEKTIEKKSVGGSALSNVKDVAKSSAGIFDKILSFGGILLSGILLNALPSIKKKIEGFAEENKEVIDNVVSVVTVVKDFAVNLFDSFTGPYSQEGSLDWLGKFNDSGKLESGVLKEVEKVFNSFGRMINAIDKALGGEGKIGNALITSDKVLHKRINGQTGVLDRATGEFTARAFTEEENRRFQSGDIRIDGSSYGSVSGSAGSLKEFIASGEGGYNSMNQGTQGNSIVGSTNNASSKIGKNLTDMTIGEIMERQAFIMNKSNPQVGNYGIYAAGKYQIIPGTMPGVVSAAGLSRSDKFSPENQEKLGDALIFAKRPYVGDYIKGKHDDIRGAMMELAREFASIPNPDTGNSFYGSGNRAFHTVDEVKEALLKERRKNQQTSSSTSTPQAPAAPTAPAQLAPSAAAKDNKSSLYSLLTSTEEDNDTNFFLIVEPVEVGS